METKMNKAIFVGIFTAIFSGVLLHLVLQQFGATGIPEMDQVISIFPVLMGAAIGGYAGKFSHAAFAKQASGSESA